jgi:DNA-binding SARP family transcriptional activator
MRYRILGPLELFDVEGRLVAFSGRSERVLLATLLLGANRVVSRDRLIDALWGDHPPETAANVLQVHISKLRRTLATPSETSSPLHTQAPGYMLRTSPGELDSDRFEELAVISRPDDGPAEVSARLTDALMLWRGSVLEGLEADASWHGDVTRLEELRVSVLERRIDAELSLGRHRELVGELEALVHEYPLREELRGKLMVALYRCGRQADALGVYRDTRQVLAEELGLDPNPALQALELAILNQSPNLEVPLAGSESTIISNRPIAVSNTNISIPLPSRLTVGPTIGLFGREAELQVITDAYKRVVGGGCRELLLVSGEPGLGKTTLVAEAARVAFASGACVLFGHCEEDLTNPYQFFAEALDHCIQHTSKGHLLAHLELHGSELSRLVPALLRRIPTLEGTKATDTDSERYLLFAAVIGMLAMISDLQPVVLILDDLQWADTGSLALLRHLAETDHAQQMLILATYRDNELAHADALRDTLGALRRHRGVSRVELAGLDDRSVVALLEAAAGQTLDEAGVGLAHAVYRETDGNPFFVGEVLRHLSETGAVYQDADGRWVAQGALERTTLPDSVREVIGGRVARLGRDAERVLSLAAVIGRDFDLELLIRATQTSEDELLDILDSAGAAALVGELSEAPGRFNFTHALIQHTLYQDLGATRRARAHRRVAEALEDLCGDRPGARVGELARHWVAAIQPVEISKAISYSQQAGDAALASLVPADALRYYTQALDLYAQCDHPDPVLELDLLTGLGTAKRQTGDATFRDTLLQACRQAIEVADTDRLVAAVLANDRGTFSTVSAIDVDKVEILETALDQLSADHPDRALILATLCTELTIGSPLDRRVSLANDALAIAERSGEDAVVARVLDRILVPLAVPHLLDLSLTRSTEAMFRAERTGDPVLLCSAVSGRRFVAACAGDIAEMDRCFEIKRRLVEQLDQPFFNWLHTLQRAARTLISGDSDQAERLATEALQTGTDGGQPDAIIVFGAQMMMVNLWRGTLGALVPLIEQAIVDNPGLPVFVGVLALAHAEADHAEDMRALLKDFARLNFDLPLDAAWLTGMIAYAEAAVECRDPHFAEPVLERLAPFADQWLYTDVATFGPVSRTVGDLLRVLDRHDEAEAHFVHASASSERARAKFFAARTNLSWGRMLAERRRPGDGEKAREKLTRAHRTATAEGYGNVERRAAETLQLLDG